MSYALVRVTRLDLSAFARATGTHPEFVRRLVAAGVLDAYRDSSGRWWFAPQQIAAVARIQRLRAAFGLNYAALGLVIDLLDRVEAAETALRSHSRQTGEPPWTRAV